MRTGRPKTELSLSAAEREALRVNVGETAFDPQISVEGRRMRPSAGRPDQRQGSSPGGEHGA